MFLESGLTIEDAIHASFLYGESRIRDLVVFRSTKNLEQSLLKARLMFNAACVIGGEESHLI